MTIAVRVVCTAKLLSASASQCPLHCEALQSSALRGVTSLSLQAVESQEEDMENMVIKMKVRLGRQVLHMCFTAGVLNSSLG